MNKVLFQFGAIQMYLFFTQNQKPRRKNNFNLTIATKIKCFITFSFTEISSFTRWSDIINGNVLCNRIKQNLFPSKIPQVFGHSGAEIIY